MKVGTVTEVKKREYRVGLTPENAKSYIQHGHEVYIQKGAGEGAGFSDGEYIKEGAKILSSADDVWNKCDMVVKVKAPENEEYEKMRQGQIVYTYFHFASSKPLTDAVIKSGCTAVAYETVTDEKKFLPLLKPMSEIAGRLSILEGSKCLQKQFGGEGLLLQGVPGVRKAHVVIIGAGTVGVNACVAAVGQGAAVTVLGRNLNKLTELDSRFGTKIQTLYCTDSSIESTLKEADLVVCAALVPGGKAPVLIKKEYLSEMKKGCVIVDVSIDQGGNCETSRETFHDSPCYTVDGVVHYCVGNIPGCVPKTATVALTNATLNYGLMIADNGIKEACRKYSSIKDGVNIMDGKIVCKEVAQAFSYEFNDICELL